MTALFADEALTQTVRDAIHDFALDARELLSREAHDLLEGVYGLHENGTLEVPENLPALKDLEAQQTYERLKQFIKDETGAGLGAAEAVTRLVKEVAFTHLNRLVAFKMLESSKLIREAVGRGPESNGFKFYLADHPADEAHWRAGKAETAYIHFLRWQAGEIAREVPVLFDPDDLASQLFPRAAILNRFLGLVNASALIPAWGAEETIGWVYQFFNERENEAVFDRLFKQKQKIHSEDIPAATQRFTPRWIVRYLVENTLGRLWLQMHPDSSLGAELRYLVPSAGNLPAEKLRQVKEISLLDPACGTMHFGLVAFDLFAEMYREELCQAGRPGWPERASVTGEAEIPAAILEHNLFGIDIDLRATQLAALTLYVKAKRLNRAAQLRVHNLACADVLPYSAADLGRFLVQMRFSNPIFERMLRRIREQLADIQQVGSLLRIERELRGIVEEQRRKDELKRRAQLALQPSLLDSDEQAALDAAHYGMLEVQLVQALDFFRQQNAGQGDDLRFFTGQAARSLRVLDLCLRRYDVVLTNPPYLFRRGMSDQMAAFLDKNYPEAKGDLYAAFIARCAELAEEAGRVGMITQQSFMFISSYEKLRVGLLETFAIETMAHTGPHAFPEIQGEKVNTTAFVLRREADFAHRRENVGTYFRLVHAPDADSKRVVFEQALEVFAPTPLPTDVYRLPQKDFDAVPGSPWAYWIDDTIRGLFSAFPNLSVVGAPKQGLITADVFRFIRFWWEAGLSNIAFNCFSRNEARIIDKTWFPYMKSGRYAKWFGVQDHIVNWRNDGYEIQNYFSASGKLASRPQNMDFYFKEGITYSYLSSTNFSARHSPGGFIFDVAGSSLFPDDIQLVLAILNSKIATFLLRLINPTLNFPVGSLANLPIPNSSSTIINNLVSKCAKLRKVDDANSEELFYFCIPTNWGNSLPDSKNSQLLENFENEIEYEIFKIYGIPENIQRKFDGYLLEQSTVLENSDDVEIAEEQQTTEEQSESTQSFSIEELAARWVSYALGVVMGRFMVGNEGLKTKDQGQRALGCAVYYRDDFAIGSLPAPDEVEFNELVGNPEQFAYVDPQGGRHVFPAEVERALNAQAFENGIAVLEAGHPHDLAARVEKALVLMLGEQGFEEVMAALGDGQSSAVLRQFLEKDYFSQKWHFKWYRKRPIYWPIQSAKRSYGFVLFHEKITRDTLYAIQREPYLDTKRNAVALKIGDLESDLPGKQGAVRKKAEKDLDDLRKLAAELAEFANDLESITLGGYNHAPEWVDDGVILRLAPLWKVIPLWKAEPKKSWERLVAGDFDWSHIAMNYWPGRVKDKCKTNKSYAIAHGHEEWYNAG